MERLRALNVTSLKNAVHTSWAVTVMIWWFFFFWDAGLYLGYEVRPEYGWFFQIKLSLLTVQCSSCKAVVAVHWVKGNSMKCVGFIMCHNYDLKWMHRQLPSSPLGQWLTVSLSVFFAVRVSSSAPRTNYPLTMPRYCDPAIKNHKLLLSCLVSKNPQRLTFLWALYMTAYFIFTNRISRFLFINLFLKNMKTT